MDKNIHTHKKDPSTGKKRPPPKRKRKKTDKRKHTLHKTTSSKKYRNTQIREGERTCNSEYTSRKKCAHYI
jgi:hypothetical protein